MFGGRIKSRRQQGQRAGVSAGRRPAAAGFERLEGRLLFAMTVFTVDADRSAIVLSGEAKGIDLERQGDRSLRASYDGVIVADVQDNSIRFLGGGELVAETRGSYDPGNAPANYAAEAEKFGVTLGQAAVRGLVMDVTSEALPLAADGSFASSGEQIAVTSGRFDYDVRSGGEGNFDLAGRSGANVTAAPSTVTTVDGVKTLTIPVDITYNYDDAELRLLGTIVGTVGSDGGTGPRVDANGPSAGTAFENLYTIGVTTDAGVVDQNGTVTDFDDTTLASGRVTLATRPDGEAERLAAFTAGTPITASYDAATGVLTLGGTASVDQYQQVLRTVTYNNTAAAPTPGDRSIQIVLNDGDGDGAAAASTIKVEEPFNANVTTIGTGANKSAVFTDADGTVTTITLAGAGTATVRFSGATEQVAAKGVLRVTGTDVRLVGVAATGTSALSKMTFKPVGGNGAVDVAGITADGALSSVGGKGVNLTGVLDVNGRIGKAAFNSLTGATVTAGSILSLAVAGNVSSSTVTAEDGFVPLAPSLGTLAVKGRVENSTIASAGNIFSVKAAGMVGSNVYAGLAAGADRFPGAGAFASEAGILKLTLKGAAGAATFDDSVIAADNLGKINLGVVDTDNAAPFGVTGDTVAGLTATNTSRQKLKLTKLDDPTAAATAIAGQTFTYGAFEVRVV